MLSVLLAWGWRLDIKYISLSIWMKVLRWETFRSATTMENIKGRFTWLMWTTRGHLIIKAGEAAKQQLRCRPAGASSALIIISPSSEVLCLHSHWNSNECATESSPSPWKGFRREAQTETWTSPAKCTCSEARWLFAFSWELQGITVAQMKTWPDYCATISSKPKNYSILQTASFCFCSPLFPFFSTDPCRDLCTLFSLSHWLLLILWHGLCQKVFFLMVNLGQHARVKYAEDGIIGSEAGSFFFFLIKSMKLNLNSTMVRQTANSLCCTLPNFECEQIYLH